MSLSRGPSVKNRAPGVSGMVSRGSSGSLKSLSRQLSNTIRRGSANRDVYTTVAEGLQHCYSKVLLPFEETSQVGVVWELEGQYSIVCVPYGPINM